MTELTRLTACATVDLLERRQVSPLELVDAAAARIAATDGAINALPTLCLDRARDQARRMMDAPRAPTGAGAGGDGRGRLHGLPIAVKDNINVADARCTSGSMAFEHRIAPASDVVVDRLEAAGAIVIGKSNLPEFATGGTTTSDVFGTIYNPSDTTKTCGGSSGGSAPALAAGQVRLATGNDFAGSGCIPSSFCGTVGLRSTAGTVARVQRQAYLPRSVEARWGAPSPIPRRCSTARPANSGPIPCRSRRRRARSCPRHASRRCPRASCSAPTWASRQWSISKSRA